MSARAELWCLRVLLAFLLLGWHKRVNESFERIEAAVWPSPQEPRRTN